jgi:hypothetical protein
MFRKAKILAQGVWAGNVEFVQTDFTSRTNFIIVRYSATKNGLPIKTRFCFQGNVEKVNRIWECICNVFVLMFIRTELCIIL